MLVGRLYGFDPRSVGSGNIGMTNVARGGGKVPAALTFIGDVLKGFVPVMVARMVLGNAAAALTLVAFAALCGATASIFLGFHGGRGVATSVGIWLAIAPAPIGIALLVFALIFATSRIVSLASISAAIVLPPAVAAMGCARPYILLSIVMSAVVVLRHRENIGRIIRGEERPVMGAWGSKAD